MNGNGKEYGWVVLHSIEGTQVADSKKYEGDALVGFGMVASQGTVTATRVDTIGSLGKSVSYNISIETDLASPAGYWVFNDMMILYLPTGYADIT
ncbi:MAG: hypothetical protein R2764_03365 [Bacteroidales bacterium]